MLLNDLLENIRCAILIPNSIRIDNGDWAIRTNPQAVNF